MRFVVVLSLPLVFALGAGSSRAADSSGGKADWQTLPKQSETAAAAGFAPCAKAPAGMSCVPGGPAIVGDDGDKGSPKRVVELSTFYIDQKEVTHDAYQACVAAKLCAPLPSSKAGLEQPALPLDWARAQSFCVWAGKRLPTEWEWEKAARGPNGDSWSWGNDAFSCQKAQARDCAPKECKPDQGKKAWSCAQHSAKPAASFPAGHYGLFDMAGNGSEWTSTWYQSDTRSCGERCNGRDPRGPCDGNTPCPDQSLQRVLKGGSFTSPSAETAPFLRRGELVTSSALNAGVRCASTTAVLTTLPPRTLSEKRALVPVPAAPTAEQVKLASAIKEDELAKQICASKGRSFIDCRDPNHYIKSNEPRQHIWRPYIENIGGGYVGVGIDQNYSFIAHARSQWAWLFDYDPMVVHLHHVLRAVILDSPDRKSFINHFQTASKDQVMELLKTTYKDHADRAAFLELYGVSRSSLLKYYEHQADGEVSVPDIVKAPTAAPDAPLRKAGVKVGATSEDPTFGWLATEEAYQYIRTLYQQGRIQILKGDMLAKNSMQGIGAAAKAMGVVIRIYYPSNAPECWPWTEQYKKNVLALPFDDRSVVLQTLSGIKGGFAKSIGYWHYNVQSGLVQQELLSRRGTGSLKQVVFERSPSDDPDLTTSGLPGG